MPTLQSTIFHAVRYALQRLTLAGFSLLFLIQRGDLSQLILEEALINAGFQVETAPDGITAIQMVKERKYDVVLTDMRMPAPKGVKDGECGLAVLKAAKEWHPEAEVIIFTAYATAKTVRLADSYNVYKYVDKPIDIEDLIQDIKSALELHGSPNFIAISESMRAIVADALKVAKTPATILLLGETGTGKDELAKFIHASSGRPSDRFVTVNCPAIPKGLFESELFGYAPKSGISGANPKGKPGLVEEADEGTLFLNLALASELGNNAERESLSVGAGFA